VNHEELSDDPNLRAFDQMMRQVFPRKEYTDDERALAAALIDLDNALCDLRDLVAEMRSSLAELRHKRQSDFKP
jgi:hypothetical protein